MKLDTSKAAWPEFQAAAERGAVAILPFGALEQHGPHLPLSTDTVMAGGLAGQLADELDAILLPPITFGEAWNNTGFPGTISLSPSTVRALAVDIGNSLAESGVRALIVVNGHFGNRAPLELAARDLLTQCGYPVLLLDYPGLEQAASEICDSKPAAPSFYHADEVETSIMLRLQPEVVQMDKAEAEYPEFPELWGSQPIRLDSFCRSGVFGDPRPATAEKGQQFLDALLSESLLIARAFLDKLPAGGER